MKILYKGKDNRERVVEIHRIKFIDDGFKEEDNKNEFMSAFSGKAMVVHIFQNKGGGRRLIFHAADNFNLEAAKENLLKAGWADLRECELDSENRY